MSEGLGLYTLKRITQSGDDRELGAFWAEHVNGATDLAVGTKGIAIYGTEGRWGFFTERKPNVLYEGCCRLSKLTPGVASGLQATYTNTAAGAPGSPLRVTAATEQRLAIEFVAPVTPAAGEGWDFFYGVEDDVSWTTSADPSIGSLLWECGTYFITVPFSHLTATWNSLNCVAFGVGGYPSADTMIPGVATLYDYRLEVDELGTNLNVQTNPGSVGGHSPVFSFGQPNIAGTTVYGIMIVVYSWSKVMIGSTLAAGSHSSDFVGTATGDLMGVRVN